MLPPRMRLLASTGAGLCVTLLATLAVSWYVEKKADAYLGSYVENSDGVDNMTALVDAMRSESLSSLICADLERRRVRGEWRALLLLSHYYLRENHPVQSLTLMAEIVRSAHDPYIQKGVRQDMLALLAMLTNPVEVDPDASSPLDVVSIREAYEPQVLKRDADRLTPLSMLLMRGMCRGRTFLIDAEDDVSAQAICATVQSIQAYGGLAVTHGEAPRMAVTVSSYDEPFFGRGIQWVEGMVPVASVVETHDQALSAGDVLHIIMRSDGDLFVGGVKVSYAYLDQSLDRAIVERVCVVIALDAECTWRQAYFLISALRGVGVRRVVFVAQRVSGATKSTGVMARRSGGALGVVSPPFTQGQVTDQENESGE